MAISRLCCITWRWYAQLLATFYALSIIAIFHPDFREVELLIEHASNIDS